MIGDVFRGNNQIAWQLQNSEDIETAIGKLKAIHTTSLLTIEYLKTVYDMDEAGDE